MTDTKKAKRASKVPKQQIAAGILSTPGERWKWVKGWGCFIVRKKKEMHFRIVDQDDFLRMVHEHILVEHPTIDIAKALVSDVAKQCEWMSGDVLDEPPTRYIALTDAVYDMEVFDFVPDPSDDSIVSTLPMPFSREEFETMKTPMFDEFLRTTFVHKDTTETDESIITVVQEMFGNIFLPDMEACTAFFLTGEGSNGKSVAIDIMRSLVGKGFCTSLSIESLTTNRFATSSLVGKRLNVCAEEESKYIQSDKFKAIVSGDTVTAERKFGGTFELTPLAKLIFASNNTPTFDGVNYGIRRRIKIIPFYRRFDAGDKTPRLAQKMLPERAGILRWAIEGAKRVRDQSYTFSIDQSEAIKNEIRHFEEDSSGVVRFVREMGYVHDPECFTEAAIIYKEYLDWCDKNTSKKMNSNNFGKDFTRFVPNSESFVKKVSGQSIRVRAVRKETLDDDPVPVEQIKF